MEDIVEMADEEMTLHDMLEIYRQDKLELQATLNSMQCKIDKNSKFISGFGVPYMDILAGEILYWISGCHRELLLGEVSEFKTTSSTVYKAFMNSPAFQVFAAQVMGVPFQPDFMDLITSVLDARHGTAHWKTLASLEAAVLNATELIATYPGAFGKAQVFIVTHFSELRQIFGI